MACGNLSNYYPIVMKFSGYVPLYSIRTRVLLILDPIGRTFWRDMGPKWDTTNYIAVVCVWDRNSQGCYRYVSFNTLVIAVPKMGQMSLSGTFPECHIFLVSRLFCHPWQGRSQGGVNGWIFTPLRSWESIKNVEFFGWLACDCCRHPLLKRTVVSKQRYCQTLFSDQ